MCRTCWNNFVWQDVEQMARCITPGVFSFFEGFGFTFLSQHLCSVSKVCFLAEWKCCALWLLNANLYTFLHRQNEESKNGVGRSILDNLGFAVWLETLVHWHLGYPELFLKGKLSLSLIILILSAKLGTASRDTEGVWRKESFISAIPYQGLTVHTNSSALPLWGFCTSWRRWNLVVHCSVRSGGRSPGEESAGRDRNGWCCCSTEKYVGECSAEGYGEPCWLILFLPLS